MMTSKVSMRSLLLCGLLAICIVGAIADSKSKTKKKASKTTKAPAPTPAAAGTKLDKFTGKGTFGIQDALCDGNGEFSGEANYKGEGEFMSEAGTFKGEGVFFISGGTFRADGADKWTCEGSGTFLLPSKTAQAKFSGNGTITGDGSYLTPSGTFKGQGKYEGMNVVFTSETAAAANLTIEPLVTELAASDAAIRILGSGIGSFVGGGEFQGEAAISGSMKGSNTNVHPSGQGTCRGNGTLTGAGTLKGEGSLTGKGTLKGKGSMDGSGTFTGDGDCEGVSVRFYEDE